MTINVITGGVATPFPGVLSPPTLVAITSVSSTTMTLTWTPPIQNGEIGYRVYDDAGTPNLMGTVLWGATGMTITGLSSVTAYTLHVVTYDGSSESNSSNTDTNTTSSASAWQLATANYVSTNVTLMPPQIIYPRPNNITSVDAYCRNAYPGMKWEIPIAVQGGSYPFKYELSDSSYTPGSGVAGTHYPIGMSIGETLDIGQAETGGTPQTVGDSYGNISWPSPTGTFETIYILVTDQDGNTTTLELTIAIDATKFIFVDGDAASEGVGSIADPLKTFVTGLWVGDDTDTTYVNKIAVFRNSTAPYVIHDGTNTTAAITAAAKPMTYIAYPGEVVNFDMSLGGGSGFSVESPDSFVSGIDFTGYAATAINYRCFIVLGAGSRSTFFRNTFDNMEFGTGGASNPACIYYSGVINQREDIAVIRCTMKPNCDIALYVGFDCLNVLLEHNVGDGINIATAHNGSFFLEPKDEQTFISVRANSAINCANVSQGVITILNQEDATTLPDSVCASQEMCWNVVEDNQGGGIVGMNIQSNSESLNTHVFRNTIVNLDPAGKYLNMFANGVGDDPTLEFNALYAGGGMNGSTYDDSLDLLANQLFALSDFDASAKLTGTARDTKLGTYGAEVA